MRVVGIIPARYGSSRLPGKPLKMIGDKSLIMRVYDQCLKVSDFTDVVVATDDKRIFDHVKDTGAKAVMTSSEHGSGTERCEEALRKIKGEFDFVLNVQGDEPFINPRHIEALIKGLNEETEIATLCAKIQTEDELRDVSIPKLVLDNRNNAMYFSRSVIPFARDDSNQKNQHLKHLGIYAYSKATLATIVQLEPSFLEQCEQLEQLRWLYNGFRIRVVEVENENSISVDTEKDLEKARLMLD